MTTPMPVSTLWTSEDVAKFTGLSLQQVHQLRAQDKGPAYVKLGRSVRYVPRRVIDWVATHTVETTDSTRSTDSAATGK